MMDLIEEANYQFLKDDRGWALYDGDDRSEVRGSRSPQLGNSIWASAKELGLTKEEE
ncbi:hypothetical protein P9A51_gp72 [Xanthomonas phage Xp12]|uniref:Uncharacterized protein n=1 Tax=Xanthomonas phage Xp12 TaxID=2746072 RepID=A0A7G9UT72_9CAUD|nr:hypothetical protein P9A51_gp72 [Xanthomonas phage Xp12]QNN97227.1 hypothetical protein [Xanthomonas phage Xp12]UGL62875.1 hypothetical protein [Xanthomonas phage MET13-T1]